MHGGGTPRTPTPPNFSHAFGRGRAGTVLALISGARPRSARAGRRNPTSVRDSRRMPNEKTNQHLAKPFMWLVIATGCVACAMSVAFVVLMHAPPFGFRFGLISVLTVAFGSRVVVQIPRVKGQISVSDIFIFLALLLFGGEAAILLAAADACFSTCTRRVAKTLRTAAFNTAVYVLSTFVTVWVLRIFFGDP